MASAASSASCAAFLGPRAGQADPGQADAPEVAPEDAIVPVVLVLDRDQAGQALPRLAVAQDQGGVLVAGQELLDQGRLVELPLDIGDAPAELALVVNDALVGDADGPGFADGLDERGVGHGRSAVARVEEDVGGDGDAARGQDLVGLELVDHGLHRPAVRADVGDLPPVELVGDPRPGRVASDERLVPRDVIEGAPDDVEVGLVDEAEELRFVGDVGDPGRVAQGLGGLAHGFRDLHVSPALGVASRACQQHDPHEHLSVRKVTVRGYRRTGPWRSGPKGARGGGLRPAAGLRRARPWRRSRRIRALSAASGPPGRQAARRGGR